MVTNSGAWTRTSLLRIDTFAPPGGAARPIRTVPPTLDRVMTHAFKKQAAQRIGSVGALADAVGQAYGLTGTHQEWAKASESDLTSRIAAKLPELMTAAAPAGPANVADSFFGEADALDTFDAPVAGSARPPAPMASAPVSYQQPDVPMGVPKSGGNMMLFVMVGGGVTAQGATFGRLVAKIPARRAEVALDRLARYYATEHREDETAAAFFNRADVVKIKQLLADLEPLSADTATKDDFIDLAETTEFRPETTEGECAT